MAVIENDMLAAVFATDAAVSAYQTGEFEIAFTVARPVLNTEPGVRSVESKAFVVARVVMPAQQARVLIANISNVLNATAGPAGRA